MPSFTRVCRRGATFYRRRVPSHLRSRCGRLEIIRRIYATTSRHAALQAQHLAYLYDQAFDLMTTQADLTLDQAIALARRWFRDQMQSDMRLLMEISPAERVINAARRGLNEGKLALLREQLANNDLNDASLVAAQIMRAEGLTVTGASLTRLSHSILRAQIALQETYENRLKGVYGPPTDSAFAADEAPEPAVAKTEPAKPSPTFTEAVEKMIAEKRAARAWDEKSERQARDTFGLFVEHAGDRPVAAYERTEIAAFRDAVLKLPRLRGKNPALTGKPLAELIAAVEAGAEPIAPKSIKRHMSIMSQVFSW